MRKSTRIRTLVVIAAVLAPLFVAAGNKGVLASVVAMVSSIHPVIAQLTGAIAPPVSDLGKISTDSTNVISLVTGTDGRIYAGTTNYGKLFAYDPSSGALSSLGQAVPGGTAVYALAPGADGKIYGGTNNNAFLFGYNPSSGTFVHPGQVVPNEMDVLSLIAAADGKIYGGTSPNAHLFRYQPGIGNLPVDLGMPVAGEAGIVGLGQTGNGLIYGATAPSGILFSYDPVSGAKQQVTSLGGKPTALAASGSSIYIGTSTGDLLAYSTGSGLQNLGKPSQDDLKIVSLTADSQGNVYGGTYPSARVFKYDPTARIFAVYSNPVEGEAAAYSLLVSVSGNLYWGTGGEGHLLKTGTQVELPTPTPQSTATPTPEPTATPVPLALPESTPTPGITPEPDALPYKIYLPLTLQSSN